MIKNTITKEAPDARGIVFRLILFMVLLFAIGIILEGCTWAEIADAAAQCTENIWKGTLTQLLLTAF
jgi:hypothetical protein